MGLLVVGTPMTWEDSLKYLKYVREKGVEQFLAIWNKNEKIDDDKLMWGDEVEYIIMKAEDKRVTIVLRSHDLLEELNTREALLSKNEGAAWHPEYGSFMVEGTPKQPYSGFASDLVLCEENMRLRRRRLISVLSPGELAPTVTTFPMMGVGEFTTPPHPPGGAASESEYVSDKVINIHPRFSTLTANIRNRRGRKVDIRVPLYQDVQTDMRGATSKRARLSKTSSNGSSSSAEPEKTSDEDSGYVHMDCMAFGMGCCCLQVTFQAANIAQSRHLYDHLAVLAPIMLAITAGTPILKGMLCDTDVRWSTIAQSVDDRTLYESGKKDIGEVEMGAGPSASGFFAGSKDSAELELMAGRGRKQLAKSRYDSISCYICNCKGGTEKGSKTDKYNDVECPVDDLTYQKLKEGGVDDKLATHYGHLFVRDPLVIYREKLYLDNQNDNDHFENIQSTNWQTVRFKPPPATPGSSHIGWRTEFRSMEVMLTDFENAAFSCFVVLASRVILAFDLNLYMAISKVDENMNRAHGRGAVLNQRFHWRSHLVKPDSEDFNKCGSGKEYDCCEEMSIKEIMLGKDKYYPGLIPLVRAYLETVKCKPDVSKRINDYLDLIAKRASGELLTTATWMRQFVTGHPHYKRDSKVSNIIAHDLMVECNEIGLGQKSCPSLLGAFHIEPVVGDHAFETPLDGKKVELSQRKALIQKYVQRGTPRSAVPSDGPLIPSLDLASGEEGASK